MSESERPPSGPEIIHDFVTRLPGKPGVYRMLGADGAILYVGKARDTHANAMAAEYIKRSTRFATCEMREIHPNKFDPWAEYPRALKVLLDPAGNSLECAEAMIWGIE